MTSPLTTFASLLYKNVSDTLGCACCATFWFLPHFDVICDLLLNRRTATWNLFVKYILLFIDDLFFFYTHASGGKSGCKWTFAFIYCYQITFD